MYVLEEDTSNDEIRAKQLSHNSISGKDDPEILKQLLDEIRDVAFKEYAHISNEILEQVKDIDYTVEMPSNEVVPVTLMFVDTSKASLDRILEELEAYTSAELENTIIMDKDYMKRLNEVTAKVSSRFKIKSTGVECVQNGRTCRQYAGWRTRKQRDRVTLRRPRRKSHLLQNGRSNFS